jgi:hypothetical protein
MYSVRRKEDPWNYVVAFACMRGLHHSRKGIKAAVGSAVAGAAFWGLVEVTQIGMDARCVNADPHRKNRLPAVCSDWDPARSGTRG